MVKVVQFEKKKVLFMLDGTAVTYAEQKYVFLFVELFQYKKAKQVLNVIAQVVSFVILIKYKDSCHFQVLGGQSGIK